MSPGPEERCQSQRKLRHRLLRMEFETFLNAFIQLPAQIIRSSRRLRYRLLTYRSATS